MSGKPSYTEYHPRWYRQRVSTYWWMERGTYLLFVLREVSSAFVAWTVVFLLMLLNGVYQGGTVYTDFQKLARHPALIALNVVSLFFITFHTITWFNLAPQAMVVKLRGNRVPGWWIAASNYVAWAAVTALTAWVILGG